MNGNGIWIRDTSRKVYARKFNLDYNLKENNIKQVDLSKYYVDYINNEYFSTIMFHNKNGDIELQWVYSNEDFVKQELEEMKLFLNHKK